MAFREGEISEPGPEMKRLQMGTDQHTLLEDLTVINQI